jgi:sigma-B regulation protein RsbU (phosphoserine phosphatase)
MNASAYDTIKSPAKKITHIYIIALLLIGLLTISSQVLVRYVLKSQSADSRVINIAGRQRMLSQKLSKTTLLLYQAQDEQEFVKRKKELQDLTLLWEKSHKALQNGDTALQIPANYNSETVKEMFILIEPHYTVMKSAVEPLLNHTLQAPKEQITPNIKEIIENEPHFLRIMNEITFQYDKEAGQKIDALKNIELVLMLITLLVLAVEAVVIFRPAINKIDEYFIQVQQSNTELLLTNAQLTKTQEELRGYIEELKATEEEIRQNAEELVAINDNLTEQKRLTEQQKDIITQRSKNITDSIKAAKRIQDAILMDQTAIISHFKGAFIIYKPKDIVSGDFYWFSEQDNKKIVVVGDCTGHGVSGALMTMVGASILNEIVNENGIFQPDNILRAMDHKLLKILQPNANGVIADGMDLSILVIEGNNLTFAAASNKLFIYRNHEILEIKGGNSPLGSFTFYTKKEYLPHSISILPNDKFYIFSDGFKDQFSETDTKKYGSKRFKELIINVGKLPMFIQREKIEEEWLRWKGNVQQTDDVMVIGLQLL